MITLPWTNIATKMRPLNVLVAHHAIFIVNKPVSFLGSISPFIYLIHGAFMLPRAFRSPGRRRLIMTVTFFCMGLSRRGIFFCYKTMPLALGAGSWYCFDQNQEDQMHQRRGNLPRVGSKPFFLSCSHTTAAAAAKIIMGSDSSTDLTRVSVCYASLLGKDCPYLFRSHGRNHVGLVAAQTSCCE